MSDRYGRAETALAWIIGGIVAIAIVDVFGPSIVASTADKPNTILYHYQTLATGLLALASAAVATFYLQRQIKVAREQMELSRKIEDETREGRRQAARTWISLHVSSIIRYANRTGEIIWDLMKQCQNNVLPHNIQVPVLPPLPMDAAVAVKEFAEFANKDEAKFLALMFSTMQVLESRMASFESAPGGEFYANLEDYLEDAAELYARAEALLGYARYSTQEFPQGVTWDRFSAALMFMTNLHDPTPRISKHIKDGMRGNSKSFMPNRFDE